MESALEPVKSCQISSCLLHLQIHQVHLPALPTHLLIHLSTQRMGWAFISMTCMLEGYFGPLWPSATKFL